MIWRQGVSSDQCSRGGKATHERMLGSYYYARFDGVNMFQQVFSASAPRPNLRPPRFLSRKVVVAVNGGRDLNLARWHDFANGLETGVAL